MLTCLNFVCFIFRCRKFKYNPKLKASVIVIFYNELLSVILRTVWSVILQTPSHLLKEIILVDDASTEGKMLKRHHLGRPVSWLRFWLLIHKLVGLV